MRPKPSIAPLAHGQHAVGVARYRFDQLITIHLSVLQELEDRYRPRASHQLAFDWHRPPKPLVFNQLKPVGHVYYVWHSMYYGAVPRMVSGSDPGL